MGISDHFCDCGLPYCSINCTLDPEYKQVPIKGIWIDSDINSKENQKYQLIFRKLIPLFSFCENFKTAKNLMIDDSTFVVICDSTIGDQVANWLQENRRRCRLIIFTQSVSTPVSWGKKMKFQVEVACSIQEVKTAIEKAKKALSIRMADPLPDIPKPLLDQLVDQKELLPSQFVESYVSQLSEHIPDVAKVVDTPAEQSDLVQYLVGSGNSMGKAKAVVAELLSNPAFSVSSTLDNATSLPEENKIITSEDPASPKFVALLWKNAPHFSVKNAVQTMKQLQAVLEIDASVVASQLTKPSVAGWRNSSFLKVYTGNYLYRELNRDLRRFQAYYNKQIGMKLLDRDLVELGSWQPERFEGWVQYILGCLSNYTNDQRSTTSFSVQNATLTRGYGFPADQLKKYAENFPVNKLFYWPAFTSTSNKQSGFQGEIQVFITPAQNTLGVAIESISEFKAEKEVLFPPFTWFKVTKCDLKPGVSLHLHVTEFPVFDYISKLPL